MSAAILERRYFAITIVSLSQRDRDTDENRLHEGVLLELPRRLQEESRDILCQASTAEPGEACNLKFSFVRANFLLIGGSHNVLLVILEQTIQLPAVRQTLEFTARHTNIGRLAAGLSCFGLRGEM